MIAQVFLNKQIVSRLRCSDGSDFPFSVTVTAYQLLVALALCGFLPKGSLPSRWVGPSPCIVPRCCIFRKNGMQAPAIGAVEAATVEPGVAVYARLRQSVSPIRPGDGFARGFRIVSMLRGVCCPCEQVSFYQTARSLGVPCTVLLTYLILREKTSVSAMICCAIMCTGFVLTHDAPTSAASTMDNAGIGSLPRAS